MAYPINPIPATSYSPAYGGIPSVPSPVSTAQEAVAGNIGNLGGLYNLAGSVNAFNQKQAPLGLETNLPGYQSTLRQLAMNAGQQAQGLLPQDVVNQMAQQAAERGISTGMGSNSPNANAALLAALGKTSIGQQQLGQENFGKLVGLTPQGPMFDPSKFFVTPDQEQQAAAAAALYKSAPVPSAAAAEARNQANAGMRSTGGGISMAPQLPAGSPFKATNWGTPASTGGSSLGTGLTYGGITYPEGSSPATATANWNSWYGSLPKSTPMGTTGTGSFYAGSANPMWADEYGMDAGGPAQAGPTSPAPFDTTYNPVSDTSTMDPFMGLGSFFDQGNTVGSLPGAGYGASTPATQSVGDLFGTLTEEDLAGFM